MLVAEGDWNQTTNYYNSFLPTHSTYAYDIMIFCWGTSKNVRNSKISFLIMRTFQAKWLTKINL